MYQVIKRDGKIVDFDINKIAAAIKKAFDATGTEYNDSIIDFLALKVSADFLPKIKDGLIAVEDVQDSVEAVLSRGGYEAVAKSYILYRKQREKLRNMKSTYLDYKDTVDKYLGALDWRVKENSTVTYSVGGLILSNSGAITANYWLSEVYDQEIADAHRNCDIHLHDLSMLTGYCAGWSLKQLIQQGLGIPGKINSSPASHLSTLCNQMVNFLGIMQNEWAGAQAFSSFDTYLAPFVRVDNLTQKEVKQCIQSFIFGVNTPSRWGTQAPFSNITLDWTVPADLKDLLHMPVLDPLAVIHNSAISVVLYASPPSHSIDPLSRVLNRGDVGVVLATVALTRFAKPEPLIRHAIVLVVQHAPATRLAIQHVALPALALHSQVHDLVVFHSTRSLVHTHRSILHVHRKHSSTPVVRYHHSVAHSRQASDHVESATSPVPAERKEGVAVAGSAGEFRNEGLLLESLNIRQLVSSPDSLHGILHEGMLVLTL